MTRSGVILTPVCLQILMGRHCENEKLSGMLASLSIVLDTRRIKSKTKKYPLKLRVTHERKSRYYPTVYDLKEEEYAKLGAPNVSASPGEVERNRACCGGSCQRTVSFQLRGI
jgi:hypothetical protein